MDEQLKNKKMIDLEQRVYKLNDEKHFLYQCFNLLTRIKELCKYSFVWKRMINEHIKVDIDVCTIALQDKIKDNEFEFRKANAVLDEYKTKINSRRHHIQTEHLGDMALRSDVDKLFGRGK